MLRYSLSGTVRATIFFSSQRAHLASDEIELVNESMSHLLREVMKAENKKKVRYDKKHFGVVSRGRYRVICNRDLQCCHWTHFGRNRGHITILL